MDWIKLITGNKSDSIERIQFCFIELNWNMINDILYSRTSTISQK